MEKFPAQPAAASLVLSKISTRKREVWGACRAGATQTWESLARMC